jgi:hypothetical protein
VSLAPKQSLVRVQGRQSPPGIGQTGPLYRGYTRPVPSVPQRGTFPSPLSAVDKSLETTPVRPIVPVMEIIEAIFCEGCGYRMQWIYERSPWGLARVVCCRRCDRPEDFAGLA